VLNFIDTASSGTNGAINRYANDTEFTGGDSSLFQSQFTFTARSNWNVPAPGYYTVALTAANSLAAIRFVGAEPRGRFHLFQSSGFIDPADPQAVWNSVTQGG